MVLVTATLAALVEIRRAHFCAEGRGRCSDLAAGGVQALVECREEEVWELVVDRARSTGTEVERKDFVGCFEDPSFPFTVPMVWAGLILSLGILLGMMYL